MKIALVHDYIKEYGGAERVLEALHELYPEAPVYTSVYLPEYLGPHKERFKEWDIRESWGGKIPFREKLISPLRLLSPFMFGSLNLADYDVVITSATGAYFPNAIYKHDALLISYCHTPPRYLYGLATAREWKKNILVRVPAELANHVLRMLDSRVSENVDFYIANSKNVAARIQKFYRRDAIVIYPPVDIQGKAESGKRKEKKANSFTLNASPYYLAGGRLARPKHIDLIVKTCAELDVSLIVFGRAFAGYELEIKSQNAKVKSAIQNSKIKFVGEIEDEEKYQLMAGAKAFLFAAEDEDFGITPVEAMACGVPVIAYRSGGVVESVVEGKTGIFFDELKVESLKKAIEQLNNVTISSATCKKRAELFSKERFKKEIEQFVKSKLHKSK